MLAVVCNVYLNFYKLSRHSHRCQNRSQYRVLASGELVSQLEVFETFLTLDTVSLYAADIAIEHYDLRHS